ncbi:hypothetical protein H8E88_27935 [candidate division KSB1 bacterium]|nr:hypothetical protein [candidate division KSB1 bacterium]
MRNGKNLTVHSTFEKVIIEAGSQLLRIPPWACAYQSNVERTHRIIEYDLLDVERLYTKSGLMGKNIMICR